MVRPMHLTALIARPSVSASHHQSTPVVRPSAPRAQSGTDRNRLPPAATPLPFARQPPRQSSARAMANLQLRPTRHSATARRCGSICGMRGACWPLAGANGPVAGYHVAAPPGPAKHTRTRRWATRDVSQTLRHAARTSWLYDRAHRAAHGGMGGRLQPRTPWLLRRAGGAALRRAHTRGTIVAAGAGRGL